MDDREFVPLLKTLEAQYLVKPSDLEALEIAPLDPKNVVEGLNRHRRDLEQSTGEKILPFFDVFDASGRKLGSTGSTDQQSQLSRLEQAHPGDLVIVNISTTKSPEDLKSRAQIRPDEQTLDILPDRNLRWIEGRNLAQS